MIRGCTNTFVLEIDDKDIDLTLATDVYVSIVQGLNQILKTGNDLTVEEKKVTVTLTQEEALRLEDGKSAEVQINWLYNADGTIKRAATVPKTIDIKKQLIPRVLP